jgi:hypothetical protein
LDPKSFETSMAIKEEIWIRETVREIFGIDAPTFS